MAKGIEINISSGLSKLILVIPWNFLPNALKYGRVKKFNYF